MSAPVEPSRSGPRARGPDRRRRPGSRARSAARGGAHGQRASRGGGPIPRASPNWPSPCVSRDCSRSSSGRSRTGATSSSLASGAGGRPVLPGSQRCRRSSGPGDDRDSLLVALVENVAREDLAGRGSARTPCFRTSSGSAWGTWPSTSAWSKSAVSNRWLLDLPDDVLGLLERGQLTEGTLALCSRSPTTRTAAARTPIVRQGMSARSRACSAAGGPGRSLAAPSRRDPALRPAHAARSSS